MRAFFSDQESFRRRLSGRWLNFCRATFSFLLLAVCAGLAGSAPAREKIPIASVPISEIGVRAGAEYKGDGLSITPTLDGAKLRAVFQKLEGELRDDGLWLRSTVEGDQTPLRVSAEAIGRERAQPEILDRRGRVQMEGPIARRVRRGVIEEYTVEVDGVRQDFVIGDRPPGEGDVHLTLDVNGATVSPVSDDSIRLKTRDTGRELRYGRLRVEDYAGRALPARFEQLDSSRIAIRIDDRDAVYPVRVDPTFSDADWVSLGLSAAGVGDIAAAAISGSGAVYVGGSFTSFAGVSANRIVQWDGNAWLPLGSGLDGAVNAIAISGSDIYVGGAFTNAGGTGASRVAKYNGGSWSALGSGVNNTVSALAVSGSDVFAGGTFTTAGGIAASAIARWDGGSWSALGTGMLRTGGVPNVRALVVSGGQVYAGGLFNQAGGNAASGIARWNGAAWSALGAGLNSDVNAIAISGSDLYAGGRFSQAGGAPASSIARWNGAAWSALSSGLSNTVWAIAISGGNVYAGGEFTSAGGSAAIRIARWNGSSWSSLGNGLDAIPAAMVTAGSEVYVGTKSTDLSNSAAKTMVPRFLKWDGAAFATVGPQPTLAFNDSVNAVAVMGDVIYAGGEFTTAGGNSAEHIAKWDGNSWSALGSGAGGPVYALTAANGNLYVAGNLLSVGDLFSSTASRIARWNGSNWFSLGFDFGGGGGTFGPARSVAVMGNDVYMGGNFSLGGQSSGVLKWNGTAWSVPGSGLDVNTGSAYALTVVGNTLYAGGSRVANGVTNPAFVARWDGISWTSIGFGPSGAVYTLAASGNDVYAGGSFPSMENVTAKNIARWDGHDWTSVGAGLNGAVRALAVSGMDLYAAGDFTTAGGTPASRIAKWSGSAWSALGSGLDSVGRALAVSNGKLYVGGDFANAGGKQSGFAASANLVALPELTGITPGAGFQSTTFPATITGRNLTGATSVTFDDPLVSAALGSGATDTSLPVIISIASSAVPGPRSVTVTTAAGVSTPLGGFTVNPTTPAITNINPKTVVPGTAVTGNITGFNLQGATAVTVSGAGVTAVIGSGGGSTTLPITISVAPGAAPGSRSVAVQTALGVSTPFNDFAVAPAFNDPTWIGMGAVPNFNPSPVMKVATDELGNVYVGGDLLVAGGTAAYGVAKWDGTRLSALGTGPSSTVMAMAASGGAVYIGGKFSYAGGVIVNGVAKWDGAAWSALGTGVNGTVKAIAISGTDVYVAGAFTTAGGVSAINIAKWNGSAWSALGAGLGNSSDTVNALAVSGGVLYAGGTFRPVSGGPAAFIAQWSGVAWSPLGSSGGPEAQVNALAVSGGNLYAGINFTTGVLSAKNIAKWDGGAWTPLGSGLNAPPTGLALSGGDLYVTGGFSQAGGVTVSGLARWDGASWSPVVSGLSGVRSIAASGSDLYIVGTSGIAKWSGGVLAPSPTPSPGLAGGSGVYDMTISGSDLYVAGQLTTVAGLPAGNVAKWNGSSWSALGSGTSGISYAVDNAGGSIYVGGQFAAAGGVPASNIARWNGSAWLPLGAGVNGVVYAIASSGNAIYAGGAFTTADGAATPFIAKWDGSAWSSLGVGLNGPAVALTIVNGDLYVGGTFTQAGGSPASGVAKWDGVQWSAVGQSFPFAGSNGLVTALAGSNGNLYATGIFATGRGFVVRWDGMNWVRIGSDAFGDFDDNVLALAIRGPEIYVGGSFTSVNGVPASGLARWDGINWSPLGSGIRGVGGFQFGDIGVVDSILIDGNSIYIGGLFATAGDKLSSDVARATLPSLIDGITPLSVPAGSTVPAVIRGSALTGATSIMFSSNGVSTEILSGGDDSNLPIMVTIDAGAALGARSLRVTTPAGVSHPFGFNVVPLLPPILSGISPPLGFPDSVAAVSFTGSNFEAGVTTINPIPGITVSGVTVTSSTSLNATFTIAPDAALGSRNVTIKTSGLTSDPVAFNVVATFPDLSVSSSHAATFAVGFQESYTIAVNNVGTADSGNFSVTDVLPAGLTFVSAGGTGWACSSSGQTVTCGHASGLGIGGSANLALTVAVGASAASTVIHSVMVTTAGDPLAENNVFGDPTIVAPTPSPQFVLSPDLAAGQQATLRVTIPFPFPRDVTGTATLSFASNALIPLDDPAIQFSTGGRQVAFTIPANTLEARIGAQAQAGPIGFQTGTVAGVFSVSGVLQAGTAQTHFSPSVTLDSLTIPLQAPSIHALQTMLPDAQTVVAQITLSSTMREVTAVTLRFNTTPVVHLSCGSTPGCSVSGSAITLDVKTLFNGWFASDVSFGSLSVLRLPLSIQGVARGTVSVTLRNTRGESNAMSFPLP